MVSDGGSDGLRDRVLRVFFLEVWNFGLSLRESGEVGGDEGASTLSENMLIDRVVDGLEEVGKGLKKHLIDEHFTFLAGEGPGSGSAGFRLFLEGCVAEPRTGLSSVA